jgi:hypothetical protein
MDFVLPYLHYEEILKLRLCCKKYKEKADIHIRAIVYTIFNSHESVIPLYSLYNIFNGKILLDDIVSYLNIRTLKIILDTRYYVIENGNTALVRTLDSSDHFHHLVDHELKSQHSLYAHNVKLNYITPYISMLNNLTMLSLINNNISKLPDELLLMDNLITLNVNNNNLVTFPQVPRFIQNLSLDDNKIDIIPGRIKNLKHLIHLRMKNNYLVRLPAELGQIGSLRYLCVIGNNIVNIKQIRDMLSNARIYF